MLLLLLLLLVDIDYWSARLHMKITSILSARTTHVYIKYYIPFEFDLLLLMFRTNNSIKIYDILFIDKG